MLLCFFKNLKLSNAAHGSFITEADYFLFT